MKLEKKLDLFGWFSVILFSCLTSFISENIIEFFLIYGSGSLWVLSWVLRYDNKEKFNEGKLK